MAEGVVASPWEAYGGAKAPAAPAAKPPPWEEAWTAVKGAYQSVKTGIEQMPEKRQEARAQLNREGNHPAALWDRAKTEFAAVPAAVKTFGEDFTKPMKNGLGARVLGTAMDAANIPLSAATAGISSLIGPQLQAVTGVDKNLASSLLVPAGLAGEAGKIRPAIGAAVGATASKAKPLYNEAKRIISPANYDKSAADAAAMHRQVFGTRGAETDRAIFSMKQHAPTVAKLTPDGLRDFMDYVEDKPGARWQSPNFVDSPARTKFQNAVLDEVDKGRLKESDAPGMMKRYDARIAKTLNYKVRKFTPELPPELKTAADAYKKITNEYRARAASVVGDKAENWKENWAPHQWQSTSKPNLSGGSGVEGSARSLKSRTFDYFSDGLDAGKVPLHANPVDTLNSYVENMGRFLGQHDILHGPDGMVAKLGAVKIAEGGPRKPPEGYVKLEGNLATERGSQKFVQDPETGRTVPKEYTRRAYYAPKGAATIYNRHVSQGMTSAVGKGVMSASNALKQTKLGLSGFHALTMANEAITSDVAQAVMQASRGDVGKAALTLGKAPAAPVSLYLRGRAMTKDVLESAKNATPGNAKIAALFERAGGRLNMDKIYGTRASGSFFNSWRRGTFQPDLKRAVANVYSGDAKIRSAFDLAGNVIQSSAAPLFEEYVPKLKMGAVHKALEDFIGSHPNATDAELEQFARATVDSMDNRFGEMIKDNLFWSKTSNQVSEMMLLSPSWQLGTIREIGGGIANVPKSLSGIAAGEGVDTKTAYTIALGGMTAIIGGVGTYLMTGDKPKGTDFIAPRTGGTSSYGGTKFNHNVPERAAVPGYAKDVLALTMGDPMAELFNKVNILPKTLDELATNKDWRGDPIYGRPAGVEAQGLAGYALETASPISVLNAENGKPTGSNIDSGARFAGIRQSPQYVSDKPGYDAMKKGMSDAAWKKKAGYEKRQKAKQAPPAAADVPPWEQYK